MGGYGEKDVGGISEGGREMKIGIDARWIFPEITGIGSYTQELIRQLAAVDATNEYVLFFNQADVRDRTVEFAGLQDAPNVTTRLLPYGLFSPWNQIRMPGEIRKTELDVFHSTNYMIPFLAFPRRAGRRRVRCVVTIHDLIPLIFPDHAPRAKKARFFALYRHLMYEVGARADTLITVSESSRQDIIGHLRIPEPDHGKVVVIAEGVSDAYAPAPRPTNRNEKWILYVGRQDPYKNVTGLIEAFDRVRRGRVPEARLRIIGPRDPRYPEAEQLIRERHLGEAVQWTGYVTGDELVKAYREADLFVLPSRYEGFGLPVLEAMASGTPVICGNRSALPEVAGDAAILVDPNDLDGLAEAMTEVLTNPDRAASLRVKGLNRAARYSWRRTAEETVRVYVNDREGKEE